MNTIPLCSLMHHLTSADTYNHVIVGDYTSPNINWWSPSLSSIHSVIVADINFHNMNWSTLSAPSIHSVDICNTFLIVPSLKLLNRPTQVEGNILDLIITTSPDLLSNVLVHGHDLPLHSDHCVISMSLTTSIFLYTPLPGNMVSTSLRLIGQASTTISAIPTLQ